MVIRLKTTGQSSINTTTFFYRSGSRNHAYKAMVGGSHGVIRLNLEDIELCYVIDEKAAATALLAVKVTVITILRAVNDFPMNKVMMNQLFSKLTRPCSPLSSLCRASAAILHSTQPLDMSPSITRRKLLNRQTNAFQSK